LNNFMANHSFIELALSLVTRNEISCLMS